MPVATINSHPTPTYPWGNRSFTLQACFLPYKGREKQIMVCTRASKHWRASVSGKTPHQSCRALLCPMTIPAGNGVTQMVLLYSHLEWRRFAASWGKKLSGWRSSRLVVFSTLARPLAPSGPHMCDANEGWAARKSMAEKNKTPLSGPQLLPDTNLGYCGVATKLRLLKRKSGKVSLSLSRSFSYWRCAFCSLNHDANLRPSSPSTRVRSSSLAMITLFSARLFFCGS